jgi:starch synthase
MPFKILFLAVEAAPFMKVGGLGDVAGSLPHAIQELPEAPDIRLVLPFYPQIQKQGRKIKPVAAFTIANNDGPIPVEVFETDQDGLGVFLIASPPISASESVYSGDNNKDGIKFTLFSLAALELASILNWEPDILHAHDWHTSPAVYHLRLSHRSREGLTHTKSLLTVHNLPYLGHGAESALNAFGLPRAHMSSLPDWAEGLPLPLGLLSADKINTVSPGYAKEMLTEEFGSGLEGFLQSRQADLSGILNGLDQDSWDPKTDPTLPANYSSDRLLDRQQNKLALLEEVGLEPNTDLPLLAMINRMDYQKGVDLVPDALRLVADLDWQMIILGTGDPQLEEAARQLDRDFPRVRSLITYDGELSRRIYGGSDLILIPSRYEPCGLTQMIGMRYGCIPLARETGGLRDTIKDYHRNPRGSTGFLFPSASAADLASCLRNALPVYKDPRKWQGLQRRGMKRDFSWKRSAQAYLHLYQQLTGRVV